MNMVHVSYPFRLITSNQLFGTATKFLTATETCIFFGVMPCVVMSTQLQNTMLRIFIDLSCKVVLLCPFDPKGLIWFSK